MPSTMPASAILPGSIPQAIECFLVSQEARALRFAQLCAPGRPALPSVQDAMRAFARHARRQPERQWPTTFWSSLSRRLPVVAAAHRAPPTVADDFLDLSTVEAALACLSPDERQLFLLRTWIGLDLAGCAAVIGRSQARTAAPMFSALRQMRASLRAKPADDCWLLRCRLLLETGVDMLGPHDRHALAAGRALAAEESAAGLFDAGAWRRAGMLTTTAVATVLLAMGLAALMRQEPVVTVDEGPARMLSEPAEQALTLSPEDLALLASPVDFGLLAELELHLWLTGSAAGDE
jgi:DNA-directed RNA polymerase specialized sigma24 family protein